MDQAADNRAATLAPVKAGATLLVREALWALRVWTEGDSDMPNAEARDLVVLVDTLLDVCGVDAKPPELPQADYEYGKLADLAALLDIAQAKVRMAQEVPLITSASEVWQALTDAEVLVRLARDALRVVE